MPIFASSAPIGAAAQLVQIAGALLVLTAFATAQVGVLHTRSRLYLALNLLGSALLAVLAAADAQLGFLLLEGVWALVSAWSLAVVLRSRRTRPLPGPRWRAVAPLRCGT